MKTYYDLTKEEYKKYEKQFKKTYVGKQWYLLQLLYGVFFICFVFGGMVDIGKIFFNEEIFNIIDVSTITEFIIMLWFGIGTLIFVVVYRNELKKYIIEKNK